MTSRKKIQQVDLKYGLFSKIVKINRAVVVEVENSFKAKPKNNETEGKDKSSTKIIALNRNSLNPNEK